MGMCMPPLPEWGAFRPGIYMGCAGIILCPGTLILWRRMEGKRPVRLSGKTWAAILAGILGVFALGAGMCFTMVWNERFLGIVLGLVGIAVLLCIIPLVKGLRQGAERRIVCRRQEAVTNRHIKVEGWFIERYLVREGESAADARHRLKQEQAQRPPQSQT